LTQMFADFNANVPALVQVSCYLRLSAFICVPEFFL